MQQQGASHDKQEIRQSHRLLSEVLLIALVLILVPDGDNQSDEPATGGPGSDGDDKDGIIYQMGV